MNKIDTLIKMLKQIVANNSAYAADDCASRVYTHIKKFWALSMKKDLIEVSSTAGADFGPVEMQVIERLRQEYS